MRVVLSADGLKLSGHRRLEVRQPLFEAVVLTEQEGVRHMLSEVLHPATRPGGLPLGQVLRLVFEYVEGHLSHHGLDVNDPVAMPRERVSLGRILHQQRLVLIEHRVDQLSSRIAQMCKQGQSV